jgi:hypothetical protein
MLCTAMLDNPGPTTALRRVGLLLLLLQGLVLDDNRANAAMALAFNSTACTYRFQQPLAFYECRLVQLQWWRTANSLRWVFDKHHQSAFEICQI